MPQMRQIVVSSKEEVLEQELRGRLSCSSSTHCIFSFLLYYYHKYYISCPGVLLHVAGLVESCPEGRWQQGFVFLFAAV
jgi:hypothetical protein